MESQKWDYKNKDLVINKVKNILEGADVEKLSDQKKEWRNAIIWFWYHHAVSCAIVRYHDKEQAQQYSSQALSFQRTNHLNRITTLLDLLVNDKLEEAERFSYTIPDEVEQDTAKSLIEEYKKRDFSEFLLCIQKDEISSFEEN